VLSQVQLEMGYLQNVYSVTFNNKVCSCKICKTLSVNPLLWIDQRFPIWLGSMWVWGQQRAIWGC